MSRPVSETLRHYKVAQSYQRNPPPSGYPIDAPWPLPKGFRWRPFPDGRPRFHVYYERAFAGVASTFEGALEVLAEHKKKLKAAADAGVDLTAPKVPRIKLRDAFPKYIASRKLDKKFTSATAYAFRFNQYVADAPINVDGKPTLLLGDVDLCDVTRAMVLRWRDRMRERVSQYKRVLAPSTINGAHKVLSSAFTWFAQRPDDYGVTVDPFDNFAYLEEQERARTIIEEKPHISDFLNECAAVDCVDLADIMVLLLATGLRISEACYFRWSSVYLDHTLANGRALPFFTTIGKGGKERSVPILDVLLPMLRRRWAEHERSKSDHALVFPGSDLRRGPRKGADPATPREPHAFELREPLPAGQYARDPKAILRMFRKAIANYNARFPRRKPLNPKMRLHDMRHTFGQHWVDDDGDLHHLQKIMGHHDLKMTLVYAKLSVRGFAGDLGRMAFDVPAPQPRLPAPGETS